MCFAGALRWNCWFKSLHNHLGTIDNQKPRSTSRAIPSSDMASQTQINSQPAGLATYSTTFRLATHCSYRWPLGRPTKGLMEPSSGNF